MTWASWPRPGQLRCWKPNRCPTSWLIAYRRYVLAHPNRYAIMPLQPRNDPLLAPSAERLMNVLLAVLRPYGLTGADAIHAARRLRATAHGFASLEAAGGFGLPEDLDASYASLIDMVVASLRRSDAGSEPARS